MEQSRGQPAGVDWGAEWDRVVDVVVVGCGAAGASAAATAAASGASVVVLDKAPSSGGTTAASRCQMWIPNNRFIHERGRIDDRDSALRYMARTAYPTLYDAAHLTLGIPGDRFRMLEAFYDNAADTIDFFVDSGAIEVEPVEWPGYYSHLPEDTCPVGRTLQPVLPDDYVPGVDPSGGQTLVDRLMAFAGDRGAELLVGHEVIHLVRSHADQVIGCEVRAGLGTVLIGARCGVIFASGGFLHDERMALDYLRGPVFGGAASPFATGDFVRIGTEMGARLGNMAHAWWDQVVVELAVINRATRGDVYAPFGDSMLMVNRYGRRAVNEKAPYNERGQAHFQWDPHRGEYPNLLLFMVFDDTLVDTADDSMFRWPVPADRRPRHYVMTADTFDDLTVELHERLERLASHTGGVTLDDGFLNNLLDTVERFNGYAGEGRDFEFHRGETPIEQAWASEPRPGAMSGSMYPLAPEGPYHCVILGPGALDTKGGPVTDEHARVLGVDGEPIGGLYGAGNCVASPAGQAYWGPGGTIGPAVTFGTIAARHAAAQSRRVPS
ncbi:MAG: FAD-binding protein [bacterium]|nr:FAD-binding protein [bacterium]